MGKKIAFVPNREKWGGNFLLRGKQLAKNFLFAKPGGFWEGEIVDAGHSPPRGKELFLVDRFGEALAPLRPPRLQHVLPGGAGAALAEPVFAFGLDFTGLKRSFHREILVEIFENSFFFERWLENIFAFFSQRQKKFRFKTDAYLFREKSSCQKREGNLEPAFALRIFFERFGVFELEEEKILA